MEERIVEVAKTTKMIAPPSQDTVKAIRDGAQATTAAVQASIEIRATASFQVGGSLYRIYPQVLVEPNHINRWYS